MVSEEKLVAAVFRGGGIGYDTVRSLYSHNIETYLLTSKKLNDGKYPGATMMICPSHLTSQGANELVTFLNKNLAPGRKVVLIPTSDDSALFLAQKRDELDERFLYLMPDSLLVEALDNKMLFYELCNKHGLPYPKTWIVRNESELEVVSREISVPVILKPFRSRQWPEAMGYKVALVHSIDEFQTIIRKSLSFSCETIIQDVIPGDPETIWFIGGLYDVDSNPVKLYVGHKLLQYPLNIGSTCFAELMWNQDMVDITNNFLRAINYSGLIDIEFKYDKRDDKYKIIEINPRNGLWHRISDDGNLDITSYYVNWLCGNKEAFNNYMSHEDGRKWIYPHEHLCSRIEQEGFIRGIGRWFRDMNKTRLRCAWNIKDLHRNWRNSRVVLGYVRRLGIRTLISGNKLGI